MCASRKKRRESDRTRKGKKRRIFSLLRISNSTKSRIFHKQRTLKYLETPSNQRKT